jgi:hypothetical protein
MKIQTPTINASRIKELAEQLEAAEEDLHSVSIADRFRFTVEEDSGSGGQVHLHHLQSAGTIIDPVVVEGVQQLLEGYYSERVIQLETELKVEINKSKAQEYEQ